MLLLQFVEQRRITTVMQQNRRTIEAIHHLRPTLIPWEQHIFRNLDLGGFAMLSAKAFKTQPTGLGPGQQRTKPLHWPNPELAWTDRILTSNRAESAKPSRAKARALTPQPPPAPIHV
jgi:hypothetical protein